MQAMVECVPGYETFDWEFGMRPSSTWWPLASGRVPYMVGVPKPKVN